MDYFDTNLENKYKSNNKKHPWFSSIILDSDKSYNGDFRGSHCKTKPFLWTKLLENR